jgi:hypothetical protein
VVRRALFGIVVLVAVLGLLFLVIQGKRHAPSSSPSPALARPIEQGAGAGGQSASIPAANVERPSPSQQGSGQFSTSPSKKSAGSAESVSVGRLVDRQTFLGPDPVMHGLDLRIIKTAIDSLNDGFLTTAFGEIPPDARIRMSPDTATQLQGQYVEYNIDDAGNPVIEGDQVRIIDYGQFQASFRDSGAGDGSFLESLAFTTPQTNYFPLAKERGNNRGPEWVFKWRRNGDVNPSTTPGTRRKRYLFPSLHAVVDKPLRKGDKLTRAASAELPAPSLIEVMGYLQVKNHRCIVLQEKMRDEMSLARFGSQAANLPPIKSTTTRTTYFDIDLRTPVRVDFQVQRTFSPEHMSSPLVTTICGPYPPRGTGKTTRKYVFQIRL